MSDQEYLHKLREQDDRIEALTDLNHNLAMQLVGMTDRLQESAGEIAAKAWDEGYGSGYNFGYDDASGWQTNRVPANPYRKEFA